MVPLELHDPNQNWRIRFWAIFIGRGFSLIGGALTQFVLLWWITDATGSVTTLGAVSMFGMLPQVLLGPFSGTLADRHSRRKIMIAANLGSAACITAMIVLFLTTHAEPWQIYILVFIRSSMQVVQQPAAAASMAMLVPASFLS